jgi:hypothetical protein
MLILLLTSCEKEEILVPIENTDTIYMYDTTIITNDTCSIIDTIKPVIIEDTVSYIDTTGMYKDTITKSGKFVIKITDRFLFGIVDYGYMLPIEEDTVEIPKFDICIIFDNDSKAVDTILNTDKDIYYIY